MLRIRFFRVGKKNQPSFKIVVCDKRKPPRGGRFLEEVGFWNPLTKEKVLREERIKYWMGQGAKPSDSVYNLLIKEKILEGKKIPLHKKKKETTTHPPHPPAKGGTLAKKPKAPPSAKAAEGTAKEKPPKEKEKPPEEIKKEPKEERPEKTTTGG